MCVKCVGMRVCMCVGGEDEVCEGVSTLLPV